VPNMPTSSAAQCAVLQQLRHEIGGCAVNMTVESDRLATLYPTARVRGRLITRGEEQPLGWAKLDAATALALGRDQLGWFVGGHPGIVAAAQQFGRLDSNPEGGVWIVVPLGRNLARELFSRWPHTGCVTNLVGTDYCAWQSRKVWVAIPEDLKRILPRARSITPGVAGLIILDPPCLMHMARGGISSWGNAHRSDRPQHIVNFRAAFESDGWQPPVVLITERPAKSANTEAVARAFCLNGFRFIAGNAFGCWEVPIIDD
jgi:hypothetical protein